MDQQTALLSGAAMTLREPQSPLCIPARCYRLIHGIERSQVFASAAVLDVADKSATRTAIWPDASAPRRGVAAGFAIHQIFAVRYLTQVRPSIITPVTIDVVNLICPSSSLKEKGDSMGVEQLRPEMPNHITTTVHGPEGRPSGASTIPLLTSDFRSLSVGRTKIGDRPGKPSEQTSIGVIGNPIADVFKLRQNGFSHVVSPHVRGQGRALLKQRFRPALSSRVTICSQARRAA